MRQLVGFPVYFSVGQLFFLKHHSQRIRCVLYLSFKELMDTPIFRIDCLGGIPLHQKLPSLLLSQEGQLREVLPGSSRDSLHECLPMSRHPLDSRCIKQVGAVLKPTDKPFWSVFKNK